MYKGIIYKYTSPSGKSYIGQTTKTLAARAGKNGEGYVRCSAFYKAITKYGFEEMKVQILENFEEEDLDMLIDKLNTAETYYIEFFDTIVPNGYNIRSGGENSIFSADSKARQHGSNHFNYRTDIDDIFLEQEYLKGKTLISLQEETGLSKETIKRHLVDRGVFQQKKYNFPVIKYNKKGEIIGRWNSASEAEREEGCGKGVVARCCRQKRRFYKGVTYRFEGDDI